MSIKNAWWRELGGEGGGPAGGESWYSAFRKGIRVPRWTNGISGEKNEMERQSWWRTEWVSVCGRGGLLMNLELWGLKCPNTYSQTLAPIFWVSKYFPTPKINDKFLSTCVHQLGRLRPADEPTVDAQVRFEPNPAGELQSAPALGIITFVFRESKKRVKAI